MDPFAWRFPHAEGYRYGKVTGRETKAQHLSDQAQQALHGAQAAQRHAPLRVGHWTLGFFALPPIRSKAVLMRCPGTPPEAIQALQNDHDRS